MPNGFSISFLLFMILALIFSMLNLYNTYTNTKNSKGSIIKGPLFLSNKKNKNHLGNILNIFQRTKLIKDKAFSLLNAGASNIVLLLDDIPDNFKKNSQSSEGFAH